MHVTRCVITYDIRCPYWQQDGQYVYVEDILSSSVYIDPRIIRILDKIQDRFEVVGNYRWFCTQWPSIREKRTETILQDMAGKKYTVGEVEQMIGNKKKG